MKARWQAVALALAGLALVLLLVGPFLIPVRPQRGLLPAERLADPDSHFVPVPLGTASVRLHYKEHGHGPRNLVLLHGFGASEFSWREVAPELARNARVVAFDRPAFGLTDRPLRASWGTAADWAAHNPYSLQAQVDLTIGLMDELGIQQAVLVGNSAGGTVAMLTALQHPERVEALVLLDPAVYSDGRRGGLRWLFDTPQAQHLGPLLARQIRSWGTNFARSAWYEPARITEEVWAGYLKPLQVENWDRGLWELTRAAAPSGLPEHLAELALPILVVTGDDDRIVPTAQSVRVAAELPQAELLVVPECGHLPHEECPAPVLAAMADFLSGLP
jgi:pimeloyl-ACP methyl ester carboxylesterase